MTRKPILLLVFCMLVSISVPAQDKADVVLLNGKIYTANELDQFAQAVAIRDSVILKVGSNTLIRTHVGDKTTVYNLNGKLVTPGLIDAHNHMVTAAETKVLSMNLLPPDIQTINDIQERIKTELERKEPGEWVYGHGFFNLSDGRMPNRHDLDAVAPENPVYIIHISGHMAVANSMALAIAGIDSSTTSPPGGIVEKDSVTNEPTGILFNHYAMILVHRHLPQYSIQEYRAAIETLMDEYHKAGITSIHDVNVGMVEKLMAYKEADSLNTLNVRCNVLYTCEVPQHVYHALNYFGVKDSTTYESGMLKLGGFKLLLDGYAPMAYCYEPTDGITWELGTWDPDTLNKVTSMIHEAGYQIAMHCMGDRAIDMALDAYEYALQKMPKADHRHRLEHCLIPTPEAIQRIKQLGLIVSFQPGAMYFSGNSYRKIFGEERLQRFMPIKTMLDMGIPLAFGSDYPTEPDLNPLLALQEAIVRKTASEYEIAPDERIGRMQAIRLHTIGSAHAAFEEDRKGSIEDSKLADMVVWSDDYFSVPINEIKDLTATAVIVNGIVYQNDLTSIYSQNSTRLPNSHKLFQTYPNPFNGTVSIDYAISGNQPVAVILTVYNLLGRKIITLLDKKTQPGQHHIVWDGKNAAGQPVAGGLYICELMVQNQKQYVRMLYQK